MWEQSPEIVLLLLKALMKPLDFALFSSICCQLNYPRQRRTNTFFNAINAFIGNGMTRWVDGQYALHAPELGLSNWENGRFWQDSILSGGVYTTRIQMDQTVSLLTR